MKRILGQENVVRNEPVDVRLEFARGKVASQLLARQAMLDGLLKSTPTPEVVSRRIVVESEIEDLQAKSRLPDEDIILTSLKPEESDDIGQEIERTTENITNGSSTLEDIDRQWDRIELLSPEVQRYLDKKLGAIAKAANEFHERREKAEGVRELSIEEQIEAAWKLFNGTEDQEVVTGVGQPDMGSETPPSQYRPSLSKEVQDSVDYESIKRALIDHGVGKRIHIFTIADRFYGSNVIHPDNFTELMDHMDKLCAEGVLKRSRRNPKLYRICDGSESDGREMDSGEKIVDAYFSRRKKKTKPLPEWYAEGTSATLVGHSVGRKGTGKSKGGRIRR